MRAVLNKFLTERVIVMKKILLFGLLFLGTATLFAQEAEEAEEVDENGWHKE